MADLALRLLLNVATCLYAVSARAKDRIFRVIDWASEEILRRHYQRTLRRRSRR